MEKTLEKGENRLKNLRLEVKEMKGEGESSIVAEEAREVAEEYKMQWEKKKEEIGKMERIKIDEERAYQGELKNGKRNGFGILFFTSGQNKGDKYEGEYKEGKKNGKGIYYWADGRRYEGEYNEGKKNGKGIYYWASGKRYEGEWKEDMKNGKGIYYWPNKDWEEG